MDRETAQGSGVGVGLKRRTESWTIRNTSLRTGKRKQLLNKNIDE